MHSSIRAPQRWTFTKWRHYLAALAVVALCTLVAWACFTSGLSDSNIVMIFLAGVALVAARCGHGPAIAAAVLSVLVFDYFFVHPSFAFAPTDAEYFITLSVMLGIGLLISELVARLQSRLNASQDQEHRTAQLYQMTRELSASAGTTSLVQMAGQQLEVVFASEVVLLLRKPQGPLQVRFGDGTTILALPANSAAAAWVAEHNRAAGWETEVWPEATALFVPMTGAHGTLGVLGIRPLEAQRSLNSEQRRMLETYANLIALSIERDRSLEEAQQAQVQVQTEQLRNSLLSAVSHDLRTPLATIAVSASSLLESSTEQTWDEKREMLQTVVDESHRLARQVDNLLDMARLDSGTVAIKRDWEVLEELVGVALARLRRELHAHLVHVTIPSEFPLLDVAGDLIEQLLVNLLENAVRYTPPGSRIEIDAVHREGRAEIRVWDNGPGLPPGSEAKLFEKFVRGHSVVADGQRGIGLGLAICQAIVRAHGGQISAGRATTGGALFLISLPCPVVQPPDTLDETSVQTVS